MMYSIKLEQLRTLSATADLDSIIRTTQYPDELRTMRIDAIAGHRDVVVTVSNSDDMTRKLCFWKDGLHKLIESRLDDTLDLWCNDIAVKSEQFVFGFLKMAGLDAYLKLETYSLDGDMTEVREIQVYDADACESLDLKYTGGDKWSVVTEANGLARGWIIDGDLEYDHGYACCMWKDLLYTAIGNDLRISSYPDGKRLGDIRIIFQHDSVICDFTVDNSFLMILHLVDGKRYQWFVFTFDDLPGRDLPMVPTNDGHFWLPYSNDEDKSEKTWYD